MTVALILFASVCAAIAWPLSLLIGNEHPLLIAWFAGLIGPVIFVVGLLVFGGPKDGPSR